MGASAQAILHGSDTYDPANVGFVMLDSGCGGALLNNEWVITAAHCVDFEHVVGKKILIIRTLSGNYFDPGLSGIAEQTAADRIILPSYASPSINYDVALVHLAKPLKINGSSSGYVQGIYPYASSDLSGKTITCYGASGNEYADPEHPDLHDTVGFGTVRQASFVVTGMDANAISHDQFNASGQAIVFSDSGGPCYVGYGGSRQLVGTRRGATDISNATSYRDWALELMYGPRVSLRQLEAWYQESPQNYYYADLRLYLKDDYDRTVYWSPCPQGGPYTWEMTGWFEDSHSTSYWYDYATINGVRYTGNNSDNHIDKPYLTKSFSGYSSGGQMTLSVHTDHTVSSAGMETLTARCLTSQPMVPYASAWGPGKEDAVQSQPHKLVARPGDSYLYDVYTWSPCPGGSAFTWEAGYQIQSKDFVWVNGTDANTNSYFEIYLTGNNWTTRRAKGGLTFGVYAPAGSPISAGVTSLKASCDAEIQCHGTTCFSVPPQLPNNVNLSTRYWNPCGYQPFYWWGSWSYENGWDHLFLDGTDYTGTSYGAWGYAGGGYLPVRMTTDSIIASAGLSKLTASCPGW